MRRQHKIFVGVASGRWDKNATKGGNLIQALTATFPNRMRRQRKICVGAASLFILMALVMDGILSRSLTRGGGEFNHNHIQGQLPPTAVTIAIRLAGEMGNNLAHIAHGYGLHLLLKRDHGLASNILLEHQNVPRKSIPAQRALQACFPEMRAFDFNGGNNANFMAALEAQTEWMNKSALLELARGINSYDESEVRVALNFFAKYFKNHHSSRPPLSPETNEAILTKTVPGFPINATEILATGNKMARAVTSNLSLPFLYAERHMTVRDFLVDKFVDEYRRFFRFDAAACCKTKPDPDESVYHFRNYEQELKQNALIKGFEEMSPNQVARDLFGHLQAGEKVAIITRFDVASARPLVKALKQRGLKVRVIANQRDVEDFCFLMHSVKEMVGMARSTYFMWAGIFSNCSVVRAYSLDSPNRREALGANGVFEHYNWTHPDLKRRFRFDLYKLDRNKKKLPTWTNPDLKRRFRLKLDRNKKTLPT